jgi:hypothetical protein
MRIFIPTYQRAHRLRTVDFLPKAHDKVTLVVRPEEVDVYATLGFDMAVLPRAVKDIAATRKAIGPIARDYGADSFIMLDDDLRILERDDSLKLTALLDGRKLIKAMKAGLKYASAVALSPRFMNNTVTENIVFTKPQSQATAYRTEDYLSLSFGKAKYFEDVDRTLQLLTDGKQTAMLYNYAVDIGRMNYDGGMASWRNYDDMMAESLMMEQRWPGIVKSCIVDDATFWTDNPGRQRPHIRTQWKKAYNQGAK